MKLFSAVGVTLVIACLFCGFLSFLLGADSTTVALWFIASSYMVFFTMIIEEDSSK